MPLCFLLTGAPFSILVFPVFHCVDAGNFRAKEDEAHHQPESLYPVSESSSLRLLWAAFSVLGEMSLPIGCLLVHLHSNKKKIKKGKEKGFRFMNIVGCTGFSERTVLLTFFVLFLVH